MQNTANVGSQTLIFGTFAVRKFCWLQGITNDEAHILAEFAGERRQDALYNIVKSGLEAAYAADKKPFDLDEFEIAGFVDKLNESKTGAGEKVINAFIGSVVNKPTDEVPDFLKQLEKDIKKAVAEAEKKEADSKETGKSKAQPKTASPSTGTISNESPTATV